MTAQTNTTAAATEYKNEAHEGFFQEFTTTRGDVVFRGGLHLPTKDGNLTLAHINNRGTGSFIRFRVEVEWAAFGTIELEIFPGWDEAKPEKTKRRCFQGSIIDVDGKLHSPVVVFQNERDDKSIYYRIVPHKPKEEGENTGGSIFAHMRPATSPSKPKEEGAPF